MSISLELEKSHGKVLSAMPSTILLSGGEGAATVGSPNGQHMLGRLCVGGAQIGFAVLPGTYASMDWLRQSPLPSEFLAIGLCPVEGVSPAIARVVSERCFLTSLDDGVPVSKVTAIDAKGGLAVEAQMHACRMHARVRRATIAEIRRQEAIESLKEAEEAEVNPKAYDMLHGRIVAARARGVNQRRLDMAQAKLKTLQPDIASVAEVASALLWEKVTMSERSSTGAITGLTKCELAGCTVSDPLPGEVMTILNDGASEALGHLKDIKDKGVSCDQWLFERVSEAAVAAAASGGVWRSGGKYILSALSRNQSPKALNAYLNTMGQKHCADGIDALVKWTEAKYTQPSLLKPPTPSPRDLPLIILCLDALPGTSTTSLPSRSTCTSTRRPFTRSTAIFTAWSSAIWPAATVRARSSQTSRRLASRSVQRAAALSRRRRTTFHSTAPAATTARATTGEEPRRLASPPRTRRLPPRCFTAHGCRPPGSAARNGCPWATSPPSRSQHIIPVSLILSSHWLRSGNLMYFNDVWNRSHTHGIPAYGGDVDDDGKGGPRISIAMLCAAANDPNAVCEFKPKAKNIYANLVDGGRRGTGLSVPGGPLSLF